MQRAVPAFRRIRFLPLISVIFPLGLSLIFDKNAESYSK